MSAAIVSPTFAIRVLHELYGTQWWNREFTHAEGKQIIEWFTSEDIGPRTALLACLAAVEQASKLNGYRSGGRESVAAREELLAMVRDGQVKRAADRYYRVMAGLIVTTTPGQKCWRSLLVAFYRGCEAMAIDPNNVPE